MFTKSHGFTPNCITRHTQQSTSNTNLNPEIVEICIWQYLPYSFASFKLARSAAGIHINIFYSFCILREHSSYSSLSSPTDFYLSATRASSLARSQPFVCILYCIDCHKQQNISVRNITIHDRFIYFIWILWCDFFFITMMLLLLLLLLACAVFAASWLLFSRVFRDCSFVKCGRFISSVVCFALCS